MMKMTVANVVPDGGGQFLILLADDDRETLLPIRIGLFEAQAIYLKLAGQQFPRPITYDLLKLILESLDAAVSRIVVTELRDGTFFARIDIKSADGGDLEIDSRPSDAIALALRTGSPIYVEEEVLNEAGVSAAMLEKQTESVAMESPATLTDSRETEDREELSEEDPIAVFGEEPSEEDPIAILREKMARAVEREEYEEAARIRDKIKELEETREQAEE